MSTTGQDRRSDWPTAFPGHDPARLVVEVLAGVIPEQPDPASVRRYTLTSSQWSEAGDKHRQRLLAEINGKAQGYAALLMLQPDRYNWVRTDWIWL